MGWSLEHLMSPKKTRQKRPKKKKRSPKGRRWLRRALGVVVLGSIAALAWLIWPFWQLSGQFATHPTEQPSRLYGRAPTIVPGWTVKHLTAELERAFYLEIGANAGRRLVPGTYRLDGGTLDIFRRGFQVPEGSAGGDHLRAHLAGGKVRSLELAGRPVSAAYLDPPLIASFYGDDLRERRPFVSIDAEIPEDLILAVLAIEDSNFLNHKGISVTSTLRAAWANFRQGEVSQGGSTITQQLVKNLYLTPERTLVRKIREAILAILLELRYEKRDIFRAYLNEIYWGRSGSVHLMGVGAAAWAYFGKEPAQLRLEESALLAGIIQSPANYSPWRHPERAKKRRNAVLARLAQLEWMEASRLAAAAARPVEVRRGPMVARRAPYFADAMAEEARRRFGIEALRDTGYALFSSLDPQAQTAAEEAVSWGIEALEKGWEKGRGKSLQAALVSVDPATGGILAYVGGRGYSQSQFDRVAHARRQPGSAFKPVVYAAAFAEHAATPASIFDDAPFEVVYDGKTWSPKNSDDLYHGPVSARVALEKSYNVPTAQLALRTGLGAIVDLAHAMGIRGRIDPFPALALGTMEATPLEMATVYATLAAGGVRPPVHGLEAAFDRQGTRLGGGALPPPKRVLDENVAFLVTHVLQGVLDRGTGRGARQQGIEDPLAGKTGTSNDRRDSWFAGYAPDRATLVWVGYDDNTRTHLSGARAALPIWSRFTFKVRPPGGSPGFAAPPGVVGAWIDPESGGLATDRCPETRAEFFLEDFPPGELCPLHGGRRARPLEQPEGIEIPEEGRRHPFKQWLRMMRKKGS